MHGKRERQSLEIHRQVAACLRDDPALIGHARANLARWSARHGNGPLRPAYQEWQALLDNHGVAGIIALITEHSERAARLRQNSPFAGILPPREVWRIKRAVNDATR